MQIEIANAQATEFEESAQQLKQEIKDLGKLKKCNFFVENLEANKLLNTKNSSIVLNLKGDLFLQEKTTKLEKRSNLP